MKNRALSIWLICLFVATPGLAGEPIKVIVEENVPAKMRDGTILRADVHRPSRGGPYPVLLMRTPYSKAGKRFDKYVKAGYIVVCQDARGRFESDGTWESLIREETHDATDGYDSVQWASKLPGSTGKVGTFGSSYNSFLQWRLAPLRPPALVAMSAQTIPARYTDLEGPGTIRPGRRLLWWAGSMAPDMRKRSKSPGPTTRAEARELWMAGEGENLLHFLPWTQLPRRVCEDETPYVLHWLKNPHLDPWKLHEGCKDIDVPNLDVVGWFDHCNGDMLLYRTMVAEGKTEQARKWQKIVIGPWSHAGRGQRKFGDLDFGPAAALDLAKLEIRWFDYWLKGKKNGLDKDAPVKIFVMGANKWRDEQEWPLSRAQEETLYFGSQGQANTPAGNGILLRRQPRSAGKDAYTYDPRDPVPSMHGPALFTIPTNRKLLAHRRDILVYQTPPLEEAIEVTGNPTVELFASSSAPDTDFFVRLVDVAPSGESRDISMGMVRARYRNGLAKPALVKPGQVVKYNIRMNPTSNLFLKGHRLLLEVTSSDFPNYDRNHNTPHDQNASVELVSAQQTIHHGGKHASRILLPVIR